MQEIWKDIIGYEGRYMISSKGRIKNYAYTQLIPNGGGIIKHPSKIKNQNLHNGYKVVTLSKENKKSSFGVHRLVALAFLSNPENKKCVNHKNGIKSDNNLENLEWNTHAENTIHSFKVLGRTGGGKGHISPLRKIILKINMDGILVKEYESMGEAEKEGFQRSCIRKCCNGVQESHNNFKWEFKN